MNPIHARFLKEFLSETETRAHHIYALMTGLPKENFYLYRFYDHINRVEGCEDRPNNTFTVQEFLDRAEAFHPEDYFGIYFHVHLDRVDSDRLEEYEDRISIDMKRETTISNLKRCMRMFLEFYCEKCQRDNRPFELTPEMAECFGLSYRDVEALRKLFSRYNTAAKRRIRAEYEALRKLDFIRKLAK